MEEPDYLSAKRYSDVMKTMWFTFMYGTAIPLGTLFSAIGITFYYYIDYYNILRRRTVKESISIQLSTGNYYLKYIEMIELLEAIIFWSAFGGATMSLTFFHVITKIDIAMFIIAILYANIPMEDISALVFPVVNNEEVIKFNIFSINHMLMVALILIPIMIEKIQLPDIRLLLNGTNF